MKSPLARFLFVLAFASALMMGGEARADAKADLAKAQSLIQRAQANLDSVDASIGKRTTPPTGSAAKLAKSRLDQAYSDLEPAGKLLATQPAEGEGVAETVEKHKAAVALYNKLIKILTGDDAPAPSGMKDGEVKLGYPHADNFKNALFTYQHKVQAPEKSLVELKAKMVEVKDPLQINHRVTGGAVELIAETRRQAGFVKEALDKLPDNGQGVAAAKQNLTDSLKQIEKVDAYVAPLHAKLMAMIDPRQFPQFDSDRRRVQQLSSEYRQDWIFTDNRARAAELHGQRKAANDEVVRIARAYLRLIEQQTEMGKQIESVAKGALSSFAEFDAKITEQKEALPESISEDLAEADKYAKEAVENQKPMWFTGGIPQRMEWAQDKLTLLKAIDAEQGAAMQEKVTAMQASLAKRADALKELIIRENPLPADQYVGEDRDAVIAVAKSGWAVQQPKAEVLAVRIPSEAWARESKWTYSNSTWYFSDRSRLQVRLIVADHDNPKQAIDRPVTVYKDHEKGDTMIGVPLRSFDEALEPGEYLLRNKIK